MSSSSARRRLLTPLEGALRLTTRLRVTMALVLVFGSSPVLVKAGRARRRSFMGGGAWASGGVGSCASDGAGVEAGSGGPRRDWRERQVVMMLPRAVCDDTVGGLAGGDARSAV